MVVPKVLESLIDDPTVVMPGLRHINKILTKIKRFHTFLDCLDILQEYL